MPGSDYTLFWFLNQIVIFNSWIRNMVTQQAGFQTIITCRNGYQSTSFAQEKKNKF